MNRLRDFAWPIRWPLALLLLAGNLTRLVPPASRDSYQLVSVGVVMLLALRLFFLDHEAREERLAKEREDRLRLADQGVEALARTLRTADEALATIQAAHAQRLDQIDGQGGVIENLERRVHRLEQSPLARAAQPTME